MPCRDDDDKPFNPFYIGPHPSQACASPEPEPQKCSPCAPNGNHEPQGATEALAEPMAATAGAALTAAGTAGSTAAGTASGSGAPSASASVAVATDEADCPLGKQGSAGNAANAENTESTGNAGNTGNATNAANAGSVVGSQSPRRRSADSLSRDEQKNGNGKGAVNSAANTGASMAGSSNVAGGLLIVGIAGPAGGVATIYSTGQIPTGSVVPNVPSTDVSPQTAPTNPNQTEEQPQQPQDESKPCRTYPCMERNGQRDGHY